MHYLIKFEFASIPDDIQLKGFFQVFVDAASAGDALERSMNAIKKSHDNSDFLKDANMVKLHYVVQIPRIESEPLFLNLEEHAENTVLYTAYPSETPEGATYYNATDFGPMYEKYISLPSRRKK